MEMVLPAAMAPPVRGGQGGRKEKDERSLPTSGDDVHIDGQLELDHGIDRATADPLSPACNLQLPAENTDTKTMTYVAGPVVFSDMGSYLVMLDLHGKAIALTDVDTRDKAVTATEAIVDLHLGVRFKAMLSTVLVRGQLWAHAPVSLCIRMASLTHKPQQCSTAPTTTNPLATETSHASSTCRTPLQTRDSTPCFCYP